MQILRPFHVCVLFMTGVVLALSAVSAVAAGPGSSNKNEKTPMHWGADQSTLNRKTRFVELRGNAYVIRDNEEVYADEIDLNQDDDKVYARGRVHYLYSDYDVRADEIYLDLRNKTGSIKNGNLSNGRFSLRGALIEQTGEKQYHIKDYDYSTCLDCPNSWELTGSDVDLTIDGYAFMKDFAVKVKDASLFWLPYMVVPIKSKRQSGLLFPRFGSAQAAGVYFIQPVYWAPNDWSDMTFGGGYYFKRGARMEWETRYINTDRSKGTANLYWIKDNKTLEFSPNLPFRYAGKIAVTQEMPLGFEAKLRVNEVSDNSYPIIYSDDISGLYEPALSSDLFFSKNDPQMSTIISLKRTRNLMYFDSNQQFINGFDNGTVQEFPKVVVNTNDQFIFGSKVATGVEARFNRFARNGGAFDYSTDVNGKPIKTVREANRLTLIPNMYTTLNPWPWLSLVPSVQYHGYFYDFDATYPSLARGYLLTQAELSLQLEKQIASDDPDVSYKHTIRPSLRYSLIPTQQQSSDHPFILQVQNQGAGQYFDNSDIVPLGTQQSLNTYFTPLGNSLTYGFLTQVYRRQVAKNGTVSVRRSFEFGMEQTLDIREMESVVPSGAPDNRIILSPLFTHFIYDGGKFSAAGDYTYFSYLDRYDPVASQLVPYPSAHRFNLGVAWNIEKGIHNGVLSFERTLGLNYSFSKLTSKASSVVLNLKYSVNDYIMPQASVTYDLVTHSPQRLVTSSFGMLLQHPSRCWRLFFAMTQAVWLGQGFSPNVAFEFNMNGDSFGGT